MFHSFGQAVSVCAGAQASTSSSSLRRCHCSNLHREAQARHRSPLQMAGQRTKVAEAMENRASQLAALLTATVATPTCLVLSADSGGLLGEQGRGDSGK